MRISRPSAGVVFVLANSHCQFLEASESQLSLVRCDRVQQIVDAYNCAEPGCILVCENSAGASLSEIAAALQGAEVQWPVIVSLCGREIAPAVQALRMGAYDVVVQPEAQALLAVLQAALLLDTRMCEARARKSQFRTLCLELTPRERQVASMVVCGMSNKQVGRCLAIKPKTVEVHRKHVMGKLQVHSAIQLVSLVVQYAEDLVAAWFPARATRNEPGGAAERASQPAESRSA